MSGTANADLISEARSRSTEHARQNPEGSVDLILRLAAALERSEALLDDLAYSTFEINAGSDESRLESIRESISIYEQELQS